MTLKQIEKVFRRKFSIKENVPVRGHAVVLNDIQLQFVWRFLRFQLIDQRDRMLENLEWGLVKAIDYGAGQPKGKKVKYKLIESLLLDIKKKGGVE